MTVSLGTRYSKCLQILNLDPVSLPGKDQIKKSFEEIALAHSERALSPVSPLDMHSRAIYERAKTAYDYLLKELQKNPSPDSFAKSFKIGLKEYLQILTSDRLFKIRLKLTQPCYCREQCSECLASDKKCSFCEGKGWVHYCEGCNRTGCLQKNLDLALSLDSFEEKHFWSEKGFQIKLDVLSEQGFYIEGSNLAIDLGLDAQKVTEANFDYKVPLKIGGVFEKSFRLFGLQNFCKSHSVLMADDYPHLPFKYIKVKPYFMPRN